MKEFKKFVNSEQSKKQKATKTVKECIKDGGMNIPEDAIKNAKFDPKDVDMVKNLTEKYKDNQDLLVNDIVKLAEKSKKEGNLDEGQLDNFEKKIKPMLNDSQKKMLKNIMEMIKK